MKRKPLPEGQRVFTFTSASKLLAAKQLVVLPVKIFVPCQNASSTPAPAVVASPQLVDPGICEFARDYAYVGSSGRKCADGTFCPSRIFGAVAVFETCPTRIGKLREQRLEQS